MPNPAELHRLDRPYWLVILSVSTTRAVNFRVHYGMHDKLVSGCEYTEPFRRRVGHSGAWCDTHNMASTELPNNDLTGHKDTLPNPQCILSWSSDVSCKACAVLRVSTTIYKLNRVCTTQW